MLTPKQFAAFTPRRKAEIRGNHVLIPHNRYGVPLGYYRDVDFASLLRQHCRDFEAILFIARMMGKRR